MLLQFAAASLRPGPEEIADNLKKSGTKPGAFRLIAR